MSEPGFNVNLWQIRIGYRYFRGMALPRSLPFSMAGEALIRDFGHARVKAVLQAIPSTGSEEEALVAAKAADNSRPSA